MQPQRSYQFQPIQDLRPRGLRAHLRRFFTRTKERPNTLVEVDHELFTRLRRAARTRRSSPQALARDLLARGLEQESLRAHTETVLNSLTPARG